METRLKRFSGLNGQDLSYFHITLLEGLTQLATIIQHGGCYGNRILRCQVTEVVFQV